MCKVQCVIVAVFMNKVYLMLKKTIGLIGHNAGHNS